MEKIPSKQNSIYLVWCKHKNFRLMPFYLKTKTQKENAVISQKVGCGESSNIYKLYHSLCCSLWRSWHVMPHRVKELEQKDHNQLRTRSPH